MQAPFYHVGIVVPDLAEARRDLSSSLGLHWASEQRRELPVMLGDRTVSRTISFTYSVEGPPHIELIAASESPWQANVGLHHVGLWSEDIVGDMEALAAQDYTVAATGINRKGNPGGFAYMNAPTGILLELVDSRTKDPFHRWIAGGEFS